MSSPDLAESLVPIAAQLIGCVRDFGPQDVAAVLAKVPDGRHDALAVVLAAMVDPDARPSQLLAWTELGPVPSREFTPPGYDVRTLRAEAMGRRAERRAEVARLSNEGLSRAVIAQRLGITIRAVERHRAAIRRAMAEAQ